MEQLPEPITISIVRRVDPERSKEAAAWARAGQELMSIQPGYLGSGWVRPDVDSPDWHMLYRFADAESLQAWERSGEREWWVASAVGIAEDAHSERRTGIEGWFDEPTSVEVASARQSAPPRWKQMISIVLVFYPLSLLAQLSIAPLTAEWPLPLRVLVTVGILAPVMTYLALPFVTRLLAPWLHRRQEPALGSL